MKFKLSDILKPEDIKPDTEVEVDEVMLKELTEDFIDDHFPKGQCQERGNALVLYARIFHITCQALPKIIKKVDQCQVK